MGTTGRRTFHHSDFDAGALAAARAGRVVSVCLPARDEERTVGAIVSSVRRVLTAGGGGVDLVDEVLVVDDGSVDGTAPAAAAAGARVVAAGEAGGGKGQALSVALAEARGDVLVFLDADVENFDAHFVTGLLGPLLTDDDVALVKGFYERPAQGTASGGGRVTELVARPVIDLLFPRLSAVRQPLAGETAAPRSVLEKTGLDPDYGIELGLLVDVADRFGVESVAQVDLGVRIHRNRPLSELRHEATDVLRAALVRALPPEARLPQR
ncbi:MAG TPA: glucosyl-3-phosphoglycerate synthase [Acidimicrobiales bacterium]|nr:glucosyl-3-phosphoglycerate synthase [Acidimicrobiales bacterium]